MLKLQQKKASLGQVHDKQTFDYSQPKDLLTMPKQIGPVLHLYLKPPISLSHSLAANPDHLFHFVTKTLLYSFSSSLS